MYIFNNDVNLSGASNDKTAAWTADLLKKAQKEPTKVLEQYVQKLRTEKDPEAINEKLAEDTRQNENSFSVLENRNEKNIKNTSRNYEAGNTETQLNDADTRDSRFWDSGLSLFTREVFPKMRERLKQNEQYYKDNSELVGEGDVVSAKDKFMNFLKSSRSKYDDIREEFIKIDNWLSEAKYLLTTNIEKINERARDQKHIDGIVENPEERAKQLLEDAKSSIDILLSQFESYRSASKKQLLMKNATGNDPQSKSIEQLRRLQALVERIRQNVIEGDDNSLRFSKDLIDNCRSILDSLASEIEGYLGQYSMEPEITGASQKSIKVVKSQALMEDVSTEVMPSEQLFDTQTIQQDYAPSIETRQEQNHPTKEIKTNIHNDKTNVNKQQKKEEQKGPKKHSLKFWNQQNRQWELVADSDDSDELEKLKDQKIEEYYHGSDYKGSSAPYEIFVNEHVKR